LPRRLHADEPYGKGQRLPTRGQTALWQITMSNLESIDVTQMRSIQAILLGALLLATAVAIQPSENFPAQNQVPQQNRTLQQTVDRAMAAHSGTIVVSDVSSGKILTSNNLNLAGTSVQTPGSTLKPFVLMALLELNRLDPAQKLICKRKLQIGSAHLDCTHPISIAQLNADDAITYSCNSYFAQVSIRLNSNELVQAFRREGFDSPTGLIENDAAGRIHTPANKDQIQLEALGDDGIEITPLELLEAYRKLALRKRNGDIGKDASVFDGLEHSVAYGMAHAGYVKEMKVAGKTGTASPRNNPRTHGFFAGYAPAEKPEIAVVVFIQHGRGLDAAAVAQQVFAEYARENRNQ